MLHLMGCMEQQGITIEAAEASGYPRPRQIKRFGLRSRGLRPDVVGRDGRRTILGAVKCGPQIGAAHLSGQLEAIARECRMLVVCMPEDTADDMIEAVFLGEQMPHWRKLRLLRYPDAKWRELSGKAGSAVPRFRDTDVRIRRDAFGW
jgi:hypothetical protein